MADERKRYVFLSYGRKDVYPQGATNAVEQEAHFPIVEKVYRHLHGLNGLKQLALEPWFDKLCLTHDRQFTDSINQAIEQSDYMLLFIGKHSMESEWCEREWKHALANCVPIIPIVLEGGWGDADIQAIYPAQILSIDGINPQKGDGTLDENHLLTKIVAAIQQKPAPLATAMGARKLPEHYIERKQYVDELKRQLGVNDKNYALRKNIVGITSQQETAALQGIGGIGKTTLALAVCADCEVRRGFDQIFWLEAGPQTEAEDAARLMQLIGAQMGDSADNYKDVQSARASLHRYLNGKRSLVVLDDVWTEGLVDQFSWAGADCRLLVTTRNKSLVEHPQQVAKLGTEEGLRLLATIFDPLNPDVSQLNDDHKAIVTTLDGYTLAIAIAGKWLMKYGQHRAGAYLKRLQAGESDLFKQLDLSKSDKNANLELSLSLSYNDLDPDEQERFRALGIFAAGSSFSQAALDAVWGLQDGFIEMQRLVDAGLLETLTPAPLPQGEGEQTVEDERFSQHNLLRAYARALLEKAGETDSVFGRYADFYTNVANQFDELPPEQWGKLDSDLPNIHAVGDELVQRTDAGQKGDLELALGFANKISHYLFMRRAVRRISWNVMGLSATHNLQARTADKTYYLRRKSYFLNELGLLWSDLGHNRKALEYYEQSLSLDQALGYQRGQATTLTNIGHVWSDLGEKRKALQYFERALPIRRELEDHKGEADTLNGIGMVWYDLGEQRKALEYFERALPLYHDIGNYNGEAFTLTNIGSAWGGLRENRKAIEYLERALRLFCAVGDQRGEAVTLNNIGMIWSDLGEQRRALTYFEQALPLFYTVGYRSGEANTLSNLGHVWSNLGEKRKALDFYEQALPLRREVEDRSGEATTLKGMGEVWDELGEQHKAIEFYQQALILFQTLGDRRAAIIMLIKLGKLWEALGEKHKTLGFYQQVLQLRGEVGDRSGEATTLNNIGLIWDNLGEKHKALDFYEQALPIFKEVGDRGGEAVTLTNIGGVWRDLGEKQKALESLERALLIRREVGDYGGEANTLLNIGMVWSRLGEKRNALDFYEQALSLYRLVENHDGETVTCFKIGKIYGDLGDLDIAIGYMSRCVEIDEQVERSTLTRDRAYLQKLIAKHNG